MSTSELHSVLNGTPIDFESTDHSPAFTLIAVATILLLGFAAHKFGRRVHVPRVTLHLLLGFLTRPSVFDLYPANASRRFPLAARVALCGVRKVGTGHRRLFEIRKEHSPEQKRKPRQRLENTRAAIEHLKAAELTELAQVAGQKSGDAL